MSYLTEFPHYDDTILLPIGYEDLSWHNDICPHIERRINASKSIAIWCDFKEYSRRETGAMFRFTVSEQNENLEDDKNDLGCFDDFDNAVLFANALYERKTKCE